MSSPAFAEIQALEDTQLAGITGQSGIVLEIGIGSISGVDASVDDFYGVDWSEAGVTIDAQKWLVDIEGGWNSDTNLGANTSYGNAEKWVGGAISKNIAVAGTLDITLDATADLENVVANGGNVADSDGGIGLTFTRSELNFKTGDMGFFVESFDLSSVGAAGTVEGGMLSSLGGAELLTLNIDGLNVVVRGNGL
ncbi:MAG: hypothetical protein CME36_08990 [unclassified Hahellaceae]|nr:hypothetical protein [Hahellaceae bacterium]|tara:strand:+ start:40606 stop:41190 length:585 start_codon:yes stop_codon:yes gene_type:complete